MMRSSVVLPGAVAAEQRDARPGFHGKLNLAQRRVIAVVLPDVLRGDCLRHFFFPGPFTGAATAARAVEQHEAQRQNAEGQT